KDRYAAHHIRIGGDQLFRSINFLDSALGLKHKRSDVNGNDSVESFGAHINAPVDVSEEIRMQRENRLQLPCSPPYPVSQFQNDSAPQGRDINIFGLEIEACERRPKPSGAPTVVT